MDHYIIMSLSKALSMSVGVSGDGYQGSLENLYNPIKKANVELILKIVLQKHLYLHLESLKTKSCWI